MPRSLCILPLLLAGCLSAQSREDYRHLENTVDRIDAERKQSAPKAEPVLADTSSSQEIDATIDLRELLDEAIQRNPELREAESRTRAALEEVHRVGALDDPIFKVETEGVPLHQPATFDRAQDTKLGLQQSFPFPGKLALRSEAALEAAKAQQEMYRGSRSDLIARLKKAYYDYYMLSKELGIHLEHSRLLADFERVTESKFQNGAAPQQDVLKAQLELVMLHNDVLFIEQRLGTTKAAINVLLGRRAGIPIGKPRDVTPTAGRQDIDALEEKAMEARPELQALKLRQKSTEAGLELAKRDAVLPDILVGFDYWQVPRGDDAWGGLVSINLPWLTGKRAAEARKMRYLAQADEMAVERARQQVYFEVRDAFLRVETARSSIALIQGELMPKSAQSVEVSRSSYENGKTSFLELLDAERSQRNVQLSYYRALAEHESALADLERAAGTNLEEKQ